MGEREIQGYRTMFFQKAAALLCTALFSTACSAEGNARDYAKHALFWVYDRYTENLVCFPRTKVAEMRDLFEPYTKGIDVFQENSFRTLIQKAFRAFPCPFMSERPELRPATRSEILGAWIFDGPSLKLRQGPRSSQNKVIPGMPLTCETVGFMEDGGYRVMVMYSLPCPYWATSLLAKSDVVQHWAMSEDGKVSIRRTDVDDYFEEWDAYVVQTPFEFRGVAFNAGELLMYMRGFKGNDMGATLRFWHLRRLD